MIKIGFVKLTIYFVMLLKSTENYFAAERNDYIFNIYDDM